MCFLQEFAQFCQDLAGAQDLSSIVSRTYKSLPVLLCVDRVSILIHDESNGKLISDQLIGVDRDDPRLESAPQPIGHSISGKCFTENKPIVVNDCSQTDLIPANMVIDLSLVSTMAVPLKAKQKIVGVLRLDDCRSMHRFNNDDVAAAAAVAAHLGVVIDHAVALHHRDIAESALRHNEDRYRSLVKATPQLIWTTDARGQVIDDIPDWRKVTGQSLERMLDSGWLEVIHPEDQERISQVWQQAVNNKSFYQTEYRLKTITGEYRWFAVRGAPVFEADGSTVREWIGACLDIESRKKAEFALRKSEEDFRQLADAMPQIVWTSRPDGWLDYYNRRWFDYTGLNLEQTQGDGWAPVLHPDDLKNCINAWSHSVATGESYEVEYRFKRAFDGAYRWHLGRALPVRDPDGKIIKWFGTCTDIDDYKLLEQQMSKSSENLEFKVAERTLELEQKAKAISFLNEMGEQLHACETQREAILTIQGFAQRVFVNDSGALLAIDTSKKYLETVAAWGTATVTDHLWDPSACWGIRRGRLYKYDGDFSGPICDHAAQSSKNQSYICLPMTARGETIGVFYLKCGTCPADSDWEGRQQLAISMAEYIVMAISNLRLRESLRAQSVRDPLTGLFNRRYMQETMQRELQRAERAAAPVSILMVDIDHFKTFNDRFGHEAGDRMLVSVAEFLMKRVRGEDIACRYGGEEFTVLLYNSSEQSALQRAQVFCDEIQTMEERYGDQKLGGVTFSIGVAVFPQHGGNFEQLLRNADEALYRSKQAGRNRVSCAVGLESA